MPNHQLDQFMHAMMWKAIPVIILASAGGMLLREFLNWIDRKTKPGVRNRRQTESKDPNPRGVEVRDPNLHCPVCNTAMVKRKARRGTNAGEAFWGCSNFPKCRGTRPI